jgi:hypothetical protein
MAKTEEARKQQSAAAKSQWTPEKRKKQAAIMRKKLLGTTWSAARHKKFSATMAARKKDRETLAAAKANGHPWTAKQHKNFAANVAARKAAGLPGNGHEMNGSALPALVGSFPLDAIPARAEPQVRKYKTRNHSDSDDARVRLVLELVKLAQQVL